MVVRSHIKKYYQVRNLATQVSCRSVCKILWLHTTEIISLKLEHTVLKAIAGLLSVSRVQNNDVDHMFYRWRWVKGY